MDVLQLIFNGDDYGRAMSVNQAIIRAHERGVLTSTSLMVTGDAAEDAVSQAHNHPTLAVGLHLTLTASRSALPAHELPHLLNARGRLPASPFLAGILCFFSSVVRAELRREIIAQFERFVDTGLPLSHVDSHHLLHLHPTLFSILLPLAEKYGAQGIRLPRDDLRLALSLDRRRLAGKMAWSSTYALLCRMAERRLRESPVGYADRVYGFLQTGSMHEAYLAALLPRIPPTVRSAEIYCHPSLQAFDGPYGPNPGDLAALLSPRVRQAIYERKARLSNYAALALSRYRRMVCPGQCSS